MIQKDTISHGLPRSFSVGRAHQLYVVAFASGEQRDLYYIVIDDSYLLATVGRVSGV